MVTHCRVAPTMLARSWWLNAARIAMPSASATPYKPHSVCNSNSNRLLIERVPSIWASAE